MAIKKTTESHFELPLLETKNCPVTLLTLDMNNPRLHIGIEIDIGTEDEVITALSDISALDELITSICTNGYLNLEPMIVIGKSSDGPFRVLEGNRRLAAIKLIRDPKLAERLGIKVPPVIDSKVLKSVEEVLVHRVIRDEDARAFVGFKHINGPQRWDAYAKARYVTEWYKTAHKKTSVSEIAAKVGDNNNTLRAYIYSLLILEQAEKEKVWCIKDRSNPGRFAFSHLYTAIGRKEYQEYLGFSDGWSDTPPLEPIKKAKLENLGEVLGYIYGSKSDDRYALVKSQNPDLKDVGFAIVHEEARLILKSRGSLDDARDALKDPSEAFYEALIAANLKIQRAIKTMPKYSGGREEIDKLIDELYEQADTLKTMNDKKKKKK